MPYSIKGEKLVREAYSLLFPEKEGEDFRLIPRLKYSGKFKDYNANVSLRGNVIEFRLCRKWKDVSREIQIGLIQELMARIFKSRARSMYIDIYNNFVKNLHIAVPKTDGPLALEESFRRVNEKYFLGIVEKPNLVWGSHSKTKLGEYNFKRDTIKISRVFSKLDAVLMDYVMYHEMLHKVNKFKSTGLRTRYHDKKFRTAEKQFENYEEVENNLKKALRYAKLKSLFSFKLF